ncbi:MAG: site-specific DNA-methyltransferase [Beijerinckiaceae bacterium]|nr:site-specific DNA-methyltransferase [Brevundimonas sp.]MCZ8302055.1 site-specific DNA-methyltransferase [Beijerinckiaceae bacterium]
MIAEHRIQYLPPERLSPYPRNARTHSRKQIRQIADSITRFGFTNPVLIDEHGMILAGHGRVEAAKLLGMAEVPCLRFDHMSEAEKRAYILADNKLALNAGWDEDLLADELKALLADSLEIDIGVTGFTIAEVDRLIDGQLPEEPGNPAEDAAPDTAPLRCAPGDLWQLGRHRLVCGDALDPGVLSILMEGEKAEMVFTDPPYNVPIEGHVSGLGKVKHREFAQASGEMSREEFTAFLRKAFEQLVAGSVDGSIHFICMDWRHMAEMLDAGEGVYSELKNLIVWAKDNGGMGTFYRSRHELIFAFKRGTAPHINSFELGQHGRYRTNVWQYKGVNTLKSGRMEELALHPTVKPVAMIADAIKDVSKRNGIVLDLFGGSGSTLIAAHKTGRRARLVELDPVYCDRILARWEHYAKDDAVQLACGWPRAANRSIEPVAAE